MNPFLLLAGIAVAALLFSATLWSTAQSLRQKGILGLAHAVAAVTIVLTMAAVAYDAPYPARATGSVLCLSATLAAIWENGWSRLLPLSLAIFGAAVANGLPFV